MSEGRNNSRYEARAKKYGLPFPRPERNKDKKKDDKRESKSKE